MMSVNSEVEKMHHGKSPVPCASGIFDCCLLPLDGRFLLQVTGHSSLFYQYRKYPQNL